MSTTRNKYFLLLTLVLGVTLACSQFTAVTPQPATDSLYTAAAQTLSVMSTQGAVTAQPSVTPTLSIAVSPTNFSTTGCSS